MSGAILLAILAGPARAGQGPAADSTFAITHVTLIDGTGAPAKSDMTVVVRGRRIATIGPAATARIPSGARVIDGSGRYL
ncbi:MAG: amidohydrolase family protein, partial [Gemmatimonadales bacterium]